MQSRLMSAVEATANVAVGYGIAVMTQVMVFPLFGLNASLIENLILGSIFTIVSLIRSYALRRMFNALRLNACSPHRAGFSFGRISQFRLCGTLDPALRPSQR